MLLMAPVVHKEVTMVTFMNDKSHLDLVLFIKRSCDLFRSRSRYDLSFIKVTIVTFL